MALQRVKCSRLANLKNHIDFPDVRQITSCSEDIVYAFTSPALVESITLNRPQHVQSVLIPHQGDYSLPILEFFQNFGSCARCRIWGKSFGPLHPMSTPWA